MYATVGGRFDRTKFDIGVLTLDGQRDADHPILELDTFRPQGAIGASWRATRSLATEWSCSTHRAACSRCVFRDAGSFDREKTNSLVVHHGWIADGKRGMRGFRGGDLVEPAPTRSSSRRSSSVTSGRSSSCAAASAVATRRPRTRQRSSSRRTPPYKALVNQPSRTRGGQVLVRPGDANNSWMVIAIGDDAARRLGLARMPLGSGPLTPNQIQTIVNWVNRGAPND
jgi:hypothetical protein